jgi:hypothetical protein
MALKPTSCSIFLILLLGGCSIYAPEISMIGQFDHPIREQMGAPTEIIPLDEGKVRWVYARGPYGEHTYFLEFSSIGKLEFFEQVLTEKRFTKIHPEQSKVEVESLIGPSFVIQKLARDRGFVNSYRYENTMCHWFHVEYTRDSRVRSTGFGLRPECRPDRGWGFLLK